VLDKARASARKLLRQSTSQSTFSINFPCGFANLLQKFTMNKVIGVAPEPGAWVHTHNTTQHNIHISKQSAKLIRM
jgi:hypothetical protein